MNETPPAEEIFGSLAPDKSKATYGRAWDDFVLFLSIGEYVADDTSAPGCEEDDLEKENGNLPLTAAPLDKFEWWLAIACRQLKRTMQDISGTSGTRRT